MDHPAMKSPSSVRLYQLYPHSWCAETGSVVHVVSDPEADRVNDAWMNHDRRCGIVIWRKSVAVDISPIQAIRHAR
jgi:hypothetical protein